MYRFSLANSVSSRTQVVDRRVFEEALNNPKVESICRSIAEIAAQMGKCTDETTRKQMHDKMGELKRGLPGFCWHAEEFKDGKRNAFSAVPSKLTMIDVDHVDEPQKLFESIKAAALAIGLVAAHITPSTFGLRLIFVRAEGVAIEQHQAWITERLQLKGVDGCTKDLPRLSFVVPRRYWLYIDYDALFEEKSIFAPSGRVFKISDKNATILNHALRVLIRFVTRFFERFSSLHRVMSFILVRIRRTLTL